MAVIHSHIKVISVGDICWVKPNLTPNLQIFYQEPLVGSVLLTFPIFVYFLSTRLLQQPYWRLEELDEDWSVIGREGRGLVSYMPDHRPLVKRRDTPAGRGERNQYWSTKTKLQHAPVLLFYYAFFYYLFHNAKKVFCYI